MRKQQTNATNDSFLQNFTGGDNRTYKHFVWMFGPNWSIYGQ